MRITKTAPRIMICSLILILAFTFMPIIPGAGGEPVKLGAIVADAAGSGVSYSSLKISKKSIDATVGASVKLSVRMRSSSSFEVNYVRLELKGPKGATRTCSLYLESGSSLNGKYSNKISFDHKDKGKWKVIGIAAYSYWGTVIKQYRNTRGYGSTLTVKSAPLTKIKFEMTKTAKVEDLVTIKATLTAGTKKLKGQNVYFSLYTFGGKPSSATKVYKVVTNSSGVASMKVPMPEVDYMRCKVTYKGKKGFGVAKEMDYKKADPIVATAYLNTPTSNWMSGMDTGSFMTKLTYNGHVLVDKKIYFKITRQQGGYLRDFGGTAYTDSNGIATFNVGGYWNSFDTASSNPVTCTVSLDHDTLFTSLDYNRWYNATPQTANFG